MRTTLSSLVVVATLLGCKDKAKPTQAAGSGSGSEQNVAPQPPQPPPAPAFATDAAKLQRYADCWAAFSAAKDDTFASCFAPDAVREQVDSVPDLVAQGTAKIVAMAKAQKAAFPDLAITPQLVIVSGNNILAIVHVAGTNSGDAAGIKPTGKKLGIFEAEIAVMSDDGTYSRDGFYVDQPTTFHQLGLLANDSSPAAITEHADKPTTLTSRGDAAEAANKAVIEKFVEAVNKKDAKAIEALVADDVKLTFHGDKQKVEGKKAFLRWWKDTLHSSKQDAFVDIKGMWTAGEYVVVSDVFTGTPSDEIVGKQQAESNKIETHVAQFFRLADGKIKEEQIFANRLKTAVQLGMVDTDQLMETLAKGGSH